MIGGEFALVIGMGAQNMKFSFRRISILECLLCQKAGCMFHSTYLRLLQTWKQWKEELSLSQVNAQ